MSIQVQWDNEEKTVLRQIFVGRWSWEEMRASDTEIKAMLASVDYPVDMIIDMRESMFLPNGPLMGNLRNAETSLPENSRSIILVGSSILTLLISRVMRLIPSPAGRRFFITTSLDEARALLIKMHHPADK